MTVPGNIFWFVAGVLVSVAAQFVIVPLIRAARHAPAGQLRSALVIGLASFTGIGGAALGLYLWFGSGSVATDVRPPTMGVTAVRPDAAPAATAPSMEAATARLAARLAASGGTAQEWQLLAQSYEFLGRTQEAVAARARAAQAGGR
jgi:cytochrome c-type biogenesis protein CcmH/NrfG